MGSDVSINDPILGTAQALDRPKRNTHSLGAANVVKQNCIAFRLSYCLPGGTWWTLKKLPVEGIWRGSSDKRQDLMRQETLNVSKSSSSPALYLKGERRDIARMLTTLP